MRLLLTFLALLTGFSAADAARPVEAVSPTSSASQIDVADAYAAAAVAVSQIQFEASIERVRPRIAAQVEMAFDKATVETTPISRSDCARE